MPHNPNNKRVVVSTPQHKPRGDSPPGEKTIQDILELEEDKRQLLQSLYSSRSILHRESMEGSIEFTRSDFPTQDAPKQHSRATDQNHQGGNAAKESNINSILQLEDSKYDFLLQYSARSFRK